MKEKQAFFVMDINSCPNNNKKREKGKASILNQLDKLEKLDKLDELEKLLKGY